MLTALKCTLDRAFSGAFRCGPLRELSVNRSQLLQLAAGDQAAGEIRSRRESRIAF
jgi:hypothetical protein